jgi:hypothetical protein
MVSFAPLQQRHADHLLAADISGLHPLGAVELMRVLCSGAGQGKFRKRLFFG